MVIGPEDQPPAPTNTDINPSASASQAQKSWVWAHLKLNSKMNKVKCLALDQKKGGEPCGTLLTQDATSSTKSMSEHLRRVHLILPPSAEKPNQLLLPNLLKWQRVEHCILRKAIGYLFAKDDLPFSIVERP
ncbi:uncharacterized protein VP01_1824g7 [Puccinia sorghi]|uniref:BED-type domain-containing protein n=1 Tax=Puccinia sorghi TaxID=27349 RepID=A0A0L6VFU9_9BASI|nr:uncharacterized protein VP01_1824g7 [Puccinia sorghi]